MKPSLRLSRAADLVRAFETFEPQTVRGPDGGLAIGYGHTLTAREGAEVDRAQAEALLLYDLRVTAEAVEACLLAPANSNQLEALTAFAFNIGLENFIRCSALRQFNRGDELGAAVELEQWCRAEIAGEAQVVETLVRRRAAEKARFLTPPDGFPKSSTPVLRPVAQANVERGRDLGLDDVAQAWPADPTEHNGPPDDDVSLDEHHDGEEPAPPPFISGDQGANFRPPVAANETLSPARPTPPKSPQPSGPSPLLDPFRPARGAALAWVRRAGGLLGAPALSRGAMALGVAGVVLFLGAVVSILNTRPVAANLLIGLLGVVCIGPAAFIVLGGRTPMSAPRSG